MGLFDDLIPGGGSASSADTGPPSPDLGMFADLVPQPPSVLGVGGRAALRGAPGALGGMAGMGAGAAIGGAVGGPIGAGIGGLIGGIGGGFAGQAAGEAGMEALPESLKERIGQSQSKIEADIAAHPIAEKVGSLLPFALTMRPGIITGPTIGQTIARTAGGAATGAGINTGIQLGENVVTGRDLMEGVPEAAATGAAFTRPWLLGRPLERLGASAAGRVLGVRRPEGETAPPTEAGPITDETRLLPPPAIEMPDANAPLPPSRQLPAPILSRADIARRELEAGGTLGPLGDNQFVAPTAAVEPAPQATQDRFQQAVDFFTEKGLTPAQSIGVVSRLHAESGLDPNIVNPQSGAFGLAQWLGDRKPAALAAAGDFQKQLDLVWHEMQTTEGRALDAISKTTTAADAARAMEHFERAGNPAFTEDAARLAAHIEAGGALPKTISRTGTAVAGGARGAEGAGEVSSATSPASALAITPPEPIGAAPAAAAEAARSPELDRANAADTPLSRAIAALAQVAPGEFLTVRRIGDIAGVTSRNQIVNLRDSLVQRGLIQAEDGRYKRSENLNTPAAAQPTPRQAETLPQLVQPPKPFEAPKPEPTPISGEVIAPEAVPAQRPAPVPERPTAQTADLFHDLMPERTPAEAARAPGPIPAPEPPPASVSPRPAPAAEPAAALPPPTVPVARPQRGAIPETAALTPEHEAVRDELYRIAKQEAPQLRLRLFNELLEPNTRRPITGMYQPERGPGGVIEHIASVALGGNDPANALHHEIVHFFRQSGIFTKGEWSALSRHADKWRDRFDIDSRYSDFPLGVRREEAVAEAYAAWHHGEFQVPPGVRRLFQKVAQFFERVGNFLRGRGYQSADDVFQRMVGGEVGSRPLSETQTPEARFQRPQSIASDEEKADLATIMHRDDRPMGQRVRDYFAGLRENAGVRFRQSFLDDTAGLENFETGTTKDGKLLDASVSPTWMARLSRNLDSVMSTVIGVPRGDGYLGGALTYNRKEGAFETAPGSKPFAAIFKPIFDSGKQDLWALWAITNRAKRLMAEGREHNVPQALIDKYANIDRQHPEFREVMRDWRDLNKRTLDLAEQTGLVNKDQRALFEREDYVPFFRALDDDAVAAPGRGGKIANIRSGIRKLTGGEEKVADIYENMVRNLSSIVDRSMKNEAMRRVVAISHGSDMLTPMSKVAREQLTTPEMRQRLEAMGLDPDQMTADAKTAAGDFFGMLKSKDPNLVSVMVDGKPQYYRVNDPLLLRSIVSMGPHQTEGIMKVLGAAKKTLTFGVTIDPAFMMRNILRDSLHAWVVTGHGFKPGWDTMKGMVDAYRNNPSAMALLAGGAGGGHFYSAQPASVRKMLEGHDFQSTLINTPMKAVHFLERLGSASEMANRVAIYDAAIREGATKAEAIARAQDMLNFTMRGDHAAMRFMTETVPFMNARIQGLYRLYRGATENPSSFLLRGGLITAAATALWLANKDDERYKALEDWDRQNYFHFFVGDQHFRLPTPFEVGAIFASIPEMLYNFMENGRQREIGNAAWSLLANQLNLDPVPQAIKPALDLWANKNSLTGAPIVNESESRLVPELRYGPNASPTLIALGQQLGLSPDQMEYVVRGYTGTLGGYALAASDSLASALSDNAHPSRRLDQVPIINSFLRQEPALSSRWLTEFYDLKQSVDQTVASINALKQRGAGAEAAKLATENPELVGLKGATTNVGNRLAQIRRIMVQIQESPTMTADEKRAQLDQLLEARNTIAKSVRPMIQVRERLSAAP